MRSSSVRPARRKRPVAVVVATTTVGSLAAVLFHLGIQYGVRSYQGSSPAAQCSISGAAVGESAAMVAQGQNACEKVRDALNQVQVSGPIEWALLNATNAGRIRVLLLHQEDIAQMTPARAIGLIGWFGEGRGKDRAAEIIAGVQSGRRYPVA